MNRTIYALIGALVSLSIIGILIYGLFFAGEPDAIPSALIGKQAKPFELTTFKGETIKLEQFRGKPVILNFWASWCISCRQEARLLEAAHEHFTPMGAVFIGIAINDTREASLAFIKRYGKTYFLGPDDKTGTISLDYGVTAVPETFLIDKKGIITDKIMGPINQKILSDFILKQLK